ncbi:MAG TPA: ATP-binding protein, partial [Chitinophagaceae bacterium]|nr:ATP-binding protein [Chitinophagaceae bacterium]
AEKSISRSIEISRTTAIIRNLNQQGITSGIFKNRGLCRTIMNVAGDTMKVYLIKIFLEVQGFREPAVSNNLKLSVFNIVQEQLNNILKHAKATEVTISLSQLKHSIALSISDNGAGFDSSEKQEEIELDNIKIVAAPYNGTVEFASQPGRGCILTVTFPLAHLL